MSYPPEAAIVSLEHNLRSFQQANQIVRSLRTILQLLQDWEVSKQLPDSPLGVLQLPVAGDNAEMLKAELPLRSVPLDGLPSLQVIIAMMADLWDQRAQQAFVAISVACDTLRPIYVTTENDSTAVPAQAGAAED